MNLDFESICRLCLKRGTFKSIFATEHSFDSVIVSCIEMIVDLTSTPVRKDDGLPPQICTKCITKLKSSYSFKKQCEKSYKTLIQDHNSTENFIKQEVLEIVCKNEVDALEDDLAIENIKVELNDGNEDSTDNLDNAGNISIDGEDHMSYDDDNTLLTEIKNNLDSNNKTNIKEKKSKKKPDKTLETLGVDVNTLKIGKDKFQCNQCPKIVNCKRSFVRHLERHLGIKSFFCDICNKYYARKWVHMQTHLRPQIKKYRCLTCGATFEQKDALNVHVKKHTDEKPHICDNCGKGFKRKELLKTHVKIHAAIKEFLCQYCSKEFHLQKNLVTHIMYKHSSEKKYQCTRCDKKFTTGNGLTMHERRHLGIKNYHCQYCEKSFVGKGALGTHLLLHTKEKKHPCRVCEVKFKRTDHRNRHEMTAHGVNFKNHKSSDVGSVPLLNS